MVLLGTSRRHGPGSGGLRRLRSQGEMPSGRSERGSRLGGMGRCHLLGRPAVPPTSRSGSSQSLRERSAPRGRSVTVVGAGQVRLIGSPLPNMPDGARGQETASSRKLPGVDGCRILARALASIWRIRSRVTSKWRPTSSRVAGTVPFRP